MTKKALVSNIEKAGEDLRGFRVLEVVNTEDDTFEVSSSLGTWKDCPDTVESFTYWYDPTLSSFRKDPNYTPPPYQEGVDLPEGKEYEWNWSTDSYDLVNIL